MKIIRLTSDFSSKIKSGLMPNVWHLSLEQAKQGHEVWIFSLSKTPSSEIKEGVKIIHLKKPRFVRFLSSLTFFNKIKKENISPDIIHSLNPLPFGLSFPLAKRKLKAKYVLSLHGSILPLEKKYHKTLKSKKTSYIFSKLALFLAKKVDLVIPVSKNIKEELLRKKIPEEKIKVIPSGIDLDFFKPGPPRKAKMIKNVLYVGRFSQVKCLPYLISAIKDLKNIKLYLVGGKKEDDDFNNIKKTIERFNLKNRVYLIPPQDQKKLLEYYHSADLFVLPSASEGFSKVLLEAMACGLPVIASKVGGIPELIKHKVSGMLIPPKNTQAITRAVKRLSNNPDLREKMIENGLKIVQNFNWKTIAQRYSQVFEKLLKTK